MSNQEFKFNPPNGPINGITFRDQLLLMLERLASNGLGQTPPEDIKDKEITTPLY